MNQFYLCLRIALRRLNVTRMQWPSPELWWSPSVLVLWCSRLGLCWTIRSWLCRSDGIYDGHKLEFKAPAAEIFRNSILSRRGKSLMWFSIFWLTRDVISVNKIWALSYFFFIRSRVSPRARVTDLDPRTRSQHLPVPAIFRAVAPLDD